jgi:hypothetical protein
MDSMKRLLLLAVAFIFSTLIISAQETVQDLSKKAGKGFLLSAANADGAYTITYKIPGDKKKNEIFYETYQFDSNLKFVKNEEISEPKISAEDKPDKTVSGFYASVGGCSSFEILSMKLKFTKYSDLKTWDYGKQRYVFKKGITSEVIKPKNGNDKYYGFAAFNSTVDESLFVLAGIDSKAHKDGVDFFVLGVNADLEITAKPVDVSGSQSLVYSHQLDNGDVVLVFAPQKGEPDITAYTYLKYSDKGEVKNKVIFKSPSPNLLIQDVSEDNGSVFFCATSTKSKEAYGEVFENYAASIVNPCFTEGKNKLDFKWLKKSGEKMESFHLLKFTDSKLDFATTAAISDFKSKFKTSPGDKGAEPYKGGKFTIQQFKVTPQGEYLIAGQLTDHTNLGLGNPVNTYEDVVCLHFDQAGQLKAQYGVGKLNNDKKSEIFPMVQKFVPSKDGKALYWVIMEVKGFKGYEDFLAAYTGSATYFPRYYPRIAKFDLSTSSIGAFSVPGNEKFYVTKNFTPIANKADNSYVFVGSDEDYKKLWVSKYMFQ